MCKMFGKRPQWIRGLLTSCIKQLKHADVTTHAFCTTLREHVYCKCCPTEQRDSALDIE